MLIPETLENGVDYKSLNVLKMAKDMTFTLRHDNLQEITIWSGMYEVKEDAIAFKFLKEVNRGVAKDFQMVLRCEVRLEVGSHDLGRGFNAGSKVEFKPSPLPRSMNTDLTLAGFEAVNLEVFYGGLVKPKEEADDFI